MGRRQLAFEQKGEQSLGVGGIVGERVRFEDVAVRRLVGDDLEWEVEAGEEAEAGAQCLVAPAGEAESARETGGVEVAGELDGADGAEGVFVGPRLRE